MTKVTLNLGKFSRCALSSSQLKYTSISASVRLLRNRTIVSFFCLSPSLSFLTALRVNFVYKMERKISMNFSRCSCWILSFRFKVYKSFRNVFLFNILYKRSLYATTHGSLYCSRQSKVRRWTWKFLCKIRVMYNFLISDSL
jgi:hypothetical protein